jgi:hypothetical protein
MLWGGDGFRGASRLPRKRGECEQRGVREFRARVIKERPTLISEILVPRVLWRFENREKFENSKILEITLQSFALKPNNIFTFI